MKAAEETAPPTMDWQVIKDNAAQGTDFSAGCTAIALSLCHRALPDF